jgi:hypothetical protein
MATNISGTAGPQPLQTVDFITVTLVPTTVVAGAFTLVTAGVNQQGAKVSNFALPKGWRQEWWVSGGRIEDQTPSSGGVSRGPFQARWHTENLLPGTYEVRMRIYPGTNAQGPRYESESAFLVVQPAPSAVVRPTSVSLERSEIPRTADVALWEVIRESTHAISFNRYSDFIDWVIGGKTPPWERLDSHEAASVQKGRQDVGSIGARRALPFPDIEPYRLLKVATEVFMMVSTGVALEDQDFSDLSIQDAGRTGLAAPDYGGLWASYLERVNGSVTLPYLNLIRRKLQESDLIPDRQRHDTEIAYGILKDKLVQPAFIEPIWSYWHEEGMLIQTINAIAVRFQNRRSRGGRDPLATLDIDPLRPLNNLLWGYIQDEQHRLSVVRRAYEYDHHYGLSLYGRAVPTLRPADSRSRFLEAFHNLLHRAAVFYKEDDDTTVKADPFPVLNALGEVHLLLTEGQHNAYGDLPWTARHEMLMQQWLLARPEFRSFLPTRVMVAYPEPWMDRVDSMKRVQDWTDVSVRHFRDLAVTGEPILLSIRFGNWSVTIDPNQAGNWARFWRQEVQWYVESYRAVTGIDLSADAGDGAGGRDLQPAVHISRRMARQAGNGNGRAPDSTSRTEQAEV